MARGLARMFNSGIEIKAIAWLHKILFSSEGKFQDSFEDVEEFLSVMFESTSPQGIHRDEIRLHVFPCLLISQRFISVPSSKASRSYFFSLLGSHNRDLCVRPLYRKIITATPSKVP